MKKLLLLSLFSFNVMAYENCTSKNTKELELCSYSNYKSEDDLLNYLYKSIATSYPEIMLEVKKTQILWIKARDEICHFDPSDGSEYKLSINTCLYEQTYERNRELKTIIAKKSAMGFHSHSVSQPRWNQYVQEHCEFMENKFSDADCKSRNQFLHFE